MKQRLNYIDALRGLTMISVVLVHVLVRSFGLNPTVSGLAVLRSTFTLPLFFMISGYFAWRIPKEYDLPKVRKAVWTRIKCLLLGTIVFDTLFLIYSTDGKGNPFAWSNGNFDSYWYTFSLLQIFIYYIAAILLARLLKREWPAWLLLTTLAIAAFIFEQTVNPATYRYYWIMAPKTMEFMQFFVAGAAIRAGGEKVMEYIARPKHLTIAIIIYTAAIGLHYYYGTWLQSVSDTLFTVNNRIICRYAGLYLVLWIFYTNRAFFDRDTAFVRGWRFIGQRTLDIYFIHYFLLPQMRWVGPYLKKGNTMLEQLIAGLAVALAVIALCLAISWLLRRAPIINQLLGQKSHPAIKSPCKA